ncbi:ferredoxin [Streptococcus suis]|nr:ferredoxin [Streptococcus suis]
MKIQLIPEKCIACGLCQTISNEFDYDNDGIVILASDPASLEKEFPDQAELLLAAKSCPTKAILAD